VLLRQQNGFIFEALRIWLGGSAVCLCILVIFVFFLQNGREEKREKQTFSYRPSSPRVAITGLNYNLSHEGETKFSVKADNFLIRKKKIGLVRFALAQEALLVNADIAVYVVHERRVERQEGKNDSFVAVGITPEKNNAFVPFAVLMKLFHLKRLSGLVMKPVRVKFYDTAEGVSQLTAMQASFNFKERSVLFKGNVEMICGFNMLKTNQLTLFPKEAKIEVKKEFTLRVNEKERVGSHLVSDFFLKSFSF
jgi:hypothetical protein